MVTGGGTSGHVLPALAIMDRLVARGRPSSGVAYVGTTRGIEARLLPPTGYAHTLLDVVGLQRSLSRRNLAFAPKLARASWRAVRLLRRIRPAAVVNVGGYASMPATFAAALCRVPVVAVSYDRRPGLASKVAARFATVTAAAFAGTPLPRARHTGAPIRAEITRVDRRADRAAARAVLGVPADRFLVTVFGGSLGARAINTAVSDLVERAAARSDLAIHHVVGDRWLGEASPARDGSSGIMYRVIGYEDRMPQLYAASDLMVTRAGASTIAEIAATGTPAILVPWPLAAEDHQTDNARTLSDVGGAILLPERDLDAGALLAEIDRLQGDPAAIDALSRAARDAGSAHRSDALLELIEEVAAR